MPEPAPHPPDQYGPNKRPEVPLPTAPGPGADTPIPWEDDPEAGDVRPPDHHGPDKPPDAPAVPSVEWEPKVKLKEGWHPAPKPADVDWVHPDATPTHRSSAKSLLQSRPNGHPTRTRSVWIAAAPDAPMRSQGQSRCLHRNPIRASNPQGASGLPASIRSGSGAP
jgi:hypothetical protein